MVQVESVYPRACGMLLAMDRDDDSSPNTLDPRDWLYHYDPETDRISFPPGHEDGYQWLRKTLAPFGISIDTIETETELDRIMDAHRDGIMALIDARLMNDKSPSLDVQLMQATLQRDYAESARLRELLKKRKEHSLKVVIPK